MNEERTCQAILSSKETCPNEARWVIGPIDGDDRWDSCGLHVIYFAKMNEASEVTAVGEVDDE